MQTPSALTCRAALMSALAISLVPLIGQAASPASDAKDWLSKVQSAYAKQGDFTARFEQVYVDKLSGRHRDESGQMWVKADGRVRFAYQVPEPKDFVFDGNQAYFYEPDNAQVTIFEHFADSPVAQAMQFLWGQGRIAQAFEASLCTDAGASSARKAVGLSTDCPKVEAHEVALRLVPRDPLPTVQHVALVLDKASARVVRSVVYDPLANETRYSFVPLEKTGPIQASTFAFVVPDGVSVLRAPPMDKPKTQGLKSDTPPPQGEAAKP